MRNLPIGGEVLPGGGVHFRVWAPRRKSVEVAIGGEYHELEPEAQGYFSGAVPHAAAGIRYRFRLDKEGEFPDPASKFQPDGPHGPSQIVDSSSFAWTDNAWRGCPLAAQIIYETHIGTFTQEGTWQAAIEHLPALAELGVTVLEVMPVADFPGKFGWGYDGVNLFAPTRLYGSPDDFRAFVDAAHATGIGVILDVVYNHFGPDGNYLGQFSGNYVTDKYETDWGEAVNFDGPASEHVREYVLANVRYWISEFHLDGLRLDATQNIYDSSPEHILAAISRTAREVAGARNIVLIGENESQHTDLIRPISRGGCGLDALWNDDLHHTAIVAMTGHIDAYYNDYRGTPQEFISAAKYGYLYQGQWYSWQNQRRGTPALDIPPAQFITFIQNHDQVANSARGQRIHELTAPGLLRAITAYLLLIPGTPMLFQGQEFAASAPFLFFADHYRELGDLVWSGRRKFLAQWQALRMPEAQDRVADPTGAATFERCKLDHSEREKRGEIYRLHRDLIRLRTTDETFQRQRQGGLDGAVLATDAFVLRFFAGTQSDWRRDRLLVVNLGRTLHFNPAPEPLLAPPAFSRWAVLFSTEDPLYGGHGTPEPDSDRNWRLPAYSAIVLRPEEQQ